MDNVNLIWCESANKVIGVNGKLPFHLPEDLNRFKELTLNSVIICGRVTYESLPACVRPLPGRYNVILTRNKDYVVEHPDVEVIHDLEAFLLLHRSKKIWIIGGAEIYKLAMKYANKLYVTIVEKSITGYTFAPVIDKSMFRQCAHSELMTSQTGLRYTFITWIRHRVVRYARVIKDNKAS